MNSCNLENLSKLLLLFSNHLYLRVFFQPAKMFSPTYVMREQEGNCFEYSVLLCSLLIGMGYDAYCVCGYATREVCLMDQGQDVCPLVKGQKEVGNDGTENTMLERA